MKLTISISDSGSGAIFTVDTRTRKLVSVRYAGGMPVEKLAARASYSGSPEKIKKSVERAWNCDCESADKDPYEAEITNEAGEILA